jgi:hypothetical protein
MISAEKALLNLVKTAGYGLVTKVASIIAANELDKIMSDNLSNFIGLILNYTMDFFIVRWVLGGKKETHVYRYILTVAIAVTVDQIMFVSINSYAKKFYPKWYEKSWSDYVAYVRYITGALTYGFVEFPLQMSFVFPK